MYGAGIKIGFVGKFSIKDNRGILSHLRIAEDIVLLSGTAEHLQTVLDELQSRSMPVGLRLKTNKPEVISNKHDQNFLFSLGNKTPEQVKGYTYIVQLVSHYPNPER